MNLHIVNATFQHMEFHYRVPEVTGARVQHIRPGSQIRVAGSPSPSEVEYIIRQHVKYGMLPIDEAEKAKSFVGLCFSVDRPIAGARIERIMARNKIVLKQRGEQVRREAAIAEGVRLETDMGKLGIEHQPDAFVTEITEVGGDKNRDYDPLSEIMRVTRNANPDGSRKEAPSKPRSRRAKSV